MSERVSYEYKNGQGDVGTGHEGVLNQAVFFPRSASIYDYDKEGKLMIDEKTGKPLYHGTIPRWASAEASIVLTVRCATLLPCWNASTRYDLPTASTLLLRLS